MKLGSYEWGITTGGSLNSRDKINLSLKLMSMRIKKRFKTTKTPLEYDISEIQLPDSKVVKYTLEYINDIHKRPLVNHCLRAYLIGEYFGKVEKLHFDREIYALSAFLHDLGLEEEFCSMHNGINCFAVEGAKISGKFLSQFDFSPKKTQIVEDAISLHLNLNVPKPKAEAYLLNKASATDTVGLYRHEIHCKSAKQIAEKYPRENFNNDIHQILKQQCQSRPKSRIAFLYNIGFGGMLKENRYDNFIY